jgi:hypothetical protein
VYFLRRNPNADQIKLHYASQDYFVLLRRKQQLEPRPAPMDLS